MNILILNKYQAEKFEPTEKTVMISITDPEIDKPNIKHLDKFMDILYLKFSDIDDNVAFGCVQMNDEQALKILRFVQQYYLQIDTLVIHCMAGISRSAGVAAALSDILGIGSKSIFNGPYIPNRYIYRKLLNMNYEHGII